MQTACSSSGTEPAQLTRWSRNRNHPHPSLAAQESNTHAVAIIYSMSFLLHIPLGRPGISTPDKVEGPRGPVGLSERRRELIITKACASVCAECLGIAIQLDAWPCIPDPSTITVLCEGEFLGPVCQRPSYFQN